jgi:hypothetical protein
MLKNVVKSYLARDSEARELVSNYEYAILSEEPTKLHDLEKNFLKMFGILLQLTVFYLPILSLVVRFDSQSQGILC